MRAKDPATDYTKETNRRHVISKMLKIPSVLF